MLRRSPWRSRGHLWRIRLRRALGRSRPGQLAKTGRTALLTLAISDRRQRAAQGSVRFPASGNGTLENVLLISHCDFTGNSGLHVYSIASELHRLGLSPVVAVPGNVRSVRDLGSPPFSVLSFRDVRRGRLRFPNGAAVEIIHAFTPRAPVRRLVADVLGVAPCPYVVHLEDNESAIVAGGSDPERARFFLEAAAGVTVVIERLLELKPEDVPGVVVWPGFDEAVLSPRTSRAEVRLRLGIEPDELVIVYPGNVHASNLEDVRSLFLAVAQLRSSGYRVVLVKTGWDFLHKSALPALGKGMRSLGWVAREHVPGLLAAADVLVQPGRSSPYNDYRFPSKVPEFLASGQPVVLPRTNIGLHLQDREEALLLDSGSADDVASKVAVLAADSELRAELGRRGRDFALRELRWQRAADAIVSLYQQVGRSESSLRPFEPATIAE